jgi:Dyp-type peroxidase family
MSRFDQTDALPAIDLTKSKVDPDDPLFQPMLDDLQTNILKGNGRKFAYHIFLQLNIDKQAIARKWISDFAKTRITSALEFERSRKAFKRSGVDGGAIFTLSISATGYAALGITKLPVETGTPANSIVHDDPAFPTGAKGSAKKLGDGNPQTDWEAPFRGNVDILIIVADSDPAKAQQLSEQIASQAAAFSTILLNQKGHVLHRKTATAESFSEAINIEHFGYADGISQPLYMKEDIDAQKSTEFWNDAEPLNLVLVADPNGKSYFSFGSFLVFRKLEQDVEAFMSAEAKLPVIKDSDGIVNKDIPGAMMVGRYRNGNITALSEGFTGSIGRESQISNDFNYSNDPPPPPSSTPAYSSKCPFFAHTRITNPRSDISIVPPDFVHSVRLTRRAIPYQDISRYGEGQENETEPSQEQLNKHRPSKGVGLLFMSYQAHIGRQFEFIQNNWANHGHIAGRNVGQDGVIGQLSDPPKTGLPFKPATPDLLDRKMPAQWGVPVSDTAPVISFGHFVRNLGGEYFFTPSISFLERIDIH